ncbi:hypothetical protein FNV43_RR07901 [Rhamnella rubrinervis]|uniref:Uncharacterized protein n=1 Tax=Rhamnella rubrinervis TaxID=2594499 RepID=A0A8K0MNF5_9ROSA|nr:hypothetical protein FNV43_RR07901 [Rhamnella rubrinervis]
MGFNISCFGNSSTTQRRPKAAEAGSVSINPSPVSSILDLITRPACCLKTYNAKRRILSPAEKNSKVMIRRRSTLEDWILSSPGLDIPDCNISSAGTELNVSRHYFCRKAHLSSTRPQMTLASKARGSFTLKKLVAKAEHEGEESDKGISSMRRNRSCKSKKVSFRLPEEADFIIIHSPEPEETFNDQESS